MSVALSAPIPCGIGWQRLKFSMSEERRESTELNAARANLVSMRDAVLRLHKALVDSERVEYERTMGPISSTNEFLRLLSNDPWFAWLSPLTRLLVNMDEALESEEQLT